MAIYEQFGSEQRVKIMASDVQPGMILVTQLGERREFSKVVQKAQDGRTVVLENLAEERPFSAKLKEMEKGRVGKGILVDIIPTADKSADADHSATNPAIFFETPQDSARSDTTVLVYSKNQPISAEPVATVMKSEEGGLISLGRKEKPTSIFFRAEPEALLAGEDKDNRYRIIYNFDVKPNEFPIEDSAYEDKAVEDEPGTKETAIPAKKSQLLYIQIPIQDMKGEKLSPNEKCRLIVPLESEESRLACVNQSLIFVGVTPSGQQGEQNYVFSRRINSKKLNELAAKMAKQLMYLVKRRSREGELSGDVKAGLAIKIAMKHTQKRAMQFIEVPEELIKSGKVRILREPDTFQ